MRSHPISRVVPFLAWALWALCLVCTVFATWAGALMNGLGVWDVVGALILLTVPTVGVFVAMREPRNTIGWLFCTSAAIEAAGSAMLAYGVYVLIGMRQASPPAAALAAVGGGLRGMGSVLLPTFLLLLFPTGRLPSRRWRVAVLIVVCLLGLEVTTQVFGQGLVDDDTRLAGVYNPLAFVGPDLSNALSALMALLLLVSVGLCVAAIVVRFRRSRGIERQQLKWFALAAVFCFFTYLVIIAGMFINLDVPAVLFYVAIAGLPIGAGIAILRYRLYDIDLIINRTLVYGSLTALLAGLYIGSVVALQTLARALTGQRGESALAIVVSTLLIAALFQPLRVRLQRFIDRRFYRQKYDAAKTLEGFAATLRGEVNLTDLERHLVGVVEETMQPAHVSLWIAK